MAEYEATFLGRNKNDLPLKHCVLMYHFQVSVRLPTFKNDPINLSLLLNSNHSLHTLCCCFNLFLIFCFDCLKENLWWDKVGKSKRWRISNNVTPAWFWIEIKERWGVQKKKSHQDATLDRCRLGKKQQLSDLKKKNHMKVFFSF